MASTIKVDNVQNQPGTNIINKCSVTTTIGAGAGETVAVCAATVNLGRSGGTVNLTSGATQTGFGRTGTVDWDTSIKTGTVTAVTGKGYFVDTTSGGITVNLPAAAVGSIVAISDYASTSASNNITITPNGSEKINAVNDDYIMSTAGLAVTLVYADATRGWKSVTGSDADATGQVNLYIAASGGNQPTATGCIVCTNYKVHKFTGPGTLTVTAGLGSIAVADYIVVAGGGGGGAYGGGGGAGGFRESHCATTSGPYTASPLAAPNTPTSGSLAITSAGGPYPIAVGGGGAGAPVVSGPAGTSGVNSSFSTITSTGGGGGGSGNTGGGVICVGAPGGSGGASGPTVPFGGGAIGTGNTPPVSPAQGFSGGASYHLPGVYQLGAGGGGAGAVGNAPPSPASPSATSSGPGGAGVTTSISASPVSYAGGGGGGSDNPPRPAGTGGSGGGGTGGLTPPAADATAGAINTGGGGGGGGGGPGPTTSGGGGGSGIVWIRYRFQ